MYMRYCGIIVGKTYRTDLSFHLEAMCTLQNATRANLSINPRYVNQGSVQVNRSQILGSTHHTGSNSCHCGK